jgi:magnesium transporter
MSIKKINLKKFDFINIEEINEKNISFLEDNFKFHHLDLEDIREKSQVPKIDIYTNYLYFVLHFPTLENQKITYQEIDFFIGENFLIAIPQGNYKIHKDLFNEITENKDIKDHLIKKSPIDLLYHILVKLFKKTDKIIENIGKEIEKLENTIFEKTPDTEMLRKIVQNKRNVASLERILEPNKFIISSISSHKNSFTNENTPIYFDNISDNLNKLTLIIKTYKDSTDGLHSVTESLLSRRTNKIISILTVISVSLLPLNLLAGFYGMNISLPFQKQPEIIFTIFGIIICFILITFYFLKKNRWL